LPIRKGFGGKWPREVVKLLIGVALDLIVVWCFDRDTTIATNLWVVAFIWAVTAAPTLIILPAALWGARLMDDRVRVGDQVRLVTVESAMGTALAGVVPCG
jgi:hypothetical protein